MPKKSGLVTPREIANRPARQTFPGPNQLAPAGLRRRTGDLARQAGQHRVWPHAVALRHWLPALFRFRRQPPMAGRPATARSRPPPLRWNCPRPKRFRTGRSGAKFAIKRPAGHSRAPTRGAVTAGNLPKGELIPRFDAKLPRRAFYDRSFCQGKVPLPRRTPGVCAGSHELCPRIGPANPPRTHRGTFPRRLPRAPRRRGAKQCTVEPRVAAPVPRRGLRASIRHLEQTSR